MSAELTGVTQEFEKGTFTLFPGLCKGCGLCIAKCRSKALEWANVLGVYGTPAVIANENCITCGVCQLACPDCAITVERK
ncbi:MAG: 4Fe-4S dicluster domain-containing protein [Desulfotomaculaceae bacterium]|nr:4Fe-4S dicluster domain-containing protein [Desulfotomaculaceae bacterium]